VRLINQKNDPDKNEGIEYSLRDLPAECRIPHGSQGYLDRKRRRCK
jgi:hypothetical protein